MQTITPCLWFNNQAEEAAHFYTSTFKNSKLGTILRYGKDGHAPEGTVMIAEFQLNGQDFTALNGGPEFAFTPAISFVVPCETQEEVDYYWEKLSEGGSEEQCGWLKDKFGVSWQIVPTALYAMLKDPDAEKVRRVTNVMLPMVKLDLAALKQAYEQG
jgi:predicted 3-demethylubiquinone-9 3-methyltransferase (glyoxalase superfamily)